MKHSWPALAAGLLAAACVRPAPPTISTVPVIAPAAPDSAPSAPGGPDVSAIPQGAPVSASASAAPSTAVAAPPAKADSAGVTSTDITRGAAGLFGDSVRGGHALAADSANGPSWDIDVESYESTDRVAHYVQLFSGSARERIEDRLDRGTQYEAMIRAKLRAAGLPEDMYYLALIESGFDPNAYSRSAAVGMWQFMTSTARDMGMRVDWWVDERRDPVKSTSAAVRFIRGLDDQFGSLYLAAAAYNGGPGRIARGLTRYADDLEGTTGDDLFFALADKDYLRSETRDYVPQLIAAALVGKDPARYGMTITPQPAFTYDSLRVGPATPLAAVARASGASVDRIQALNPHILRGVTPPNDSLFVRVPVGTADSAAAALAALPASERVGLRTERSKKGQSLASLARKAGLTTRQLALYNPTVKRLKSGNLAAGQAVLIPTAAVVAAAAPVPDPAIERYATTRSTTMHVVKTGETLSGIAKKYHTTTAALMRDNGLRRALIFPGQSLVVHGAKAAASASSHSAPKRGSRRKRSEVSTARTHTKTPVKKPAKKVGAGKRGAH